MAGILGAPLGGGWRLPPPYETIAAEQAAMGPATPGYGAGTPGVAERSGVPTRAGLMSVLAGQSQAPAQPQQDSLAAYLEMMGGQEQKKRPVWKDILGSVLDGIASAGGGQGAYWSTIQKEGDEAKKVREKLAEMIYQRQAKQEDRSAALEDWKVKEQWQRDNPAPTQMTETERLIEQWHSLPDSDPRKAMIARALRGSAYDPSVYQPKEDYQVAGRLKVKTTAPGKAPTRSPAAKIPSGFILD